MCNKLTSARDEMPRKSLATCQHVINSQNQFAKQGRSNVAGNGNAPTQICIVWLLFEPQVPAVLNEGHKFACLVRVKHSKHGAEQTHWGSPHKAPAVMLSPCSVRSSDTCPSWFCPGFPSKAAPPLGNTPTCTPPIPSHLSD